MLSNQPPKNLTTVLDLDKLSTPARSFIEALEGHPDLPMRLAKMALVLKLKEQKSDAKAIASAARKLAPNDFPIRVLTDWLNRNQAPLWHFGIIHDDIRNQTYARALRHFIKPGMIVYEIGTGTGILAMLAAQAGARHVYTCEIRKDVAEVARNIIEHNGFTDRITVINKDALTVRLGDDIPERADLYVAEIVDNTLLGEQVLPLTECARERILKPNAILLPHTVSARGCLISGRGHNKHYRMGTVMGFDLSPFNRFTPVELNGGKGGGEFDRLSKDFELASFDLTKNAPHEARKRINITASKAGNAEAIMRWLHLDFGGGITFENRPPQKSSWDPHIHIFPTATNVSVGDTLEFDLFHNRDRLFLWPSENASGAK